MAQKANITQKDLASISQLLTSTAATLVIIIGVRYIGNDLVAPLLMSVFLAVIMLPVFRWYRAKKFSANVSLGLTIFSFLAVVIGLGIFMTWSFSLIRESMQTHVAQLQRTVQLYVSSEAIENSVSQYVTPEFVLSLFGTLFGGMGNFVFYFLVIPILAMLILLQIDAFLISAPKKMKITTQARRYQKFATSIEMYVFGRFKVNAITGLLLAVCLFFLGIDFALVWGVLTIFLSFIPYLGIVLAGIPPVLIALSNYGWLHVGLVIGAITVINLFTENVLGPHIQGKSNKLSTATVVVALIFWSWMLGALGAIMAVPLTVLLKTILADYRETAWLASIMEGYYVPPDKETKSKIDYYRSHLDHLNPFSRSKKTQSKNSKSKKKS